MRWNYDNVIYLMNHRKFLLMLKYLLDNISDFVATRSFDFHCVAFFIVIFHTIGLHLCNLLFLHCSLQIYIDGLRVDDKCCYLTFFPKRIHQLCSLPQSLSNEPIAISMGSHNTCFLLLVLVYQIVFWSFSVSRICICRYQ